MERNKKLKDIYGISFNLMDVPVKDRCGMHEWYDAVINKTYAELDMFDITRMLIQKIFLEVAIIKAEEYVRNDPFCGQRYDGELLELLLMSDLFCFWKDESYIKKMLLEVLAECAEHNWGSESEREEFENIIKEYIG